MIKTYKKKNCYGCGACKSICENFCIKMKSDNEGFIYPEIDSSLCTDCKKCETVCPLISNNNTNKIKQKTFQKALAAHSLNDNVRGSASSGGVFRTIAEYVLSDHGYVIGVSMSEDCKRAQQVVAASVEELNQLVGSKYIQSETINYNKVKGYLDNGHIVLFSGTPCQIKGLQLFLGKEYDNLLCIDIICHGVASPKVWQKYVSMMEDKFGAKVKHVFFRKKTLGWRHYSIRILFENKKQYEKYFRDDFFGRLYRSNICLRPVCYRCPFRVKERMGDISLGDFWNVRQLYFDDDRGTSIILCNSKKGEKYLMKIENNICSKLIDNKDIIEPIFACIERNKNRPLFFENIDGIEIEENGNKYIQKEKSLIQKMKSVLFVVIIKLKTKQENRI